MEAKYTMDLTSRLALYHTLSDLCENNIAHYQGDSSKRGRRFHASFTELREQIAAATPIVGHVLHVAGEFDFDAETPANGYRSFLAVIDACVIRAIKVGQEICDKRGSILFKKRVYSRRIESCRHLMASLMVCLQQLTTLLSISGDGDLYVDEVYATDFLKLAAALNVLPFYGRLIGFQYCKSMQKILRHISIAMVSYNKCYESKSNSLGKAAILVWSGGRYTRSSEKRAKKLAFVSRNASIEFLKSFWFTSERKLAYKATNFIGPSVAVNKIITIPTEPMFMTAQDGQRVSIPIPTSYFGPAPISAHLYSSVKRQGMDKTSSGSLAPPSPYLLFHCHGGGFVAQSPRSHEVYLREWACKLDMPIFSVDYSLAPRAPFPRPLEEVVYAYCWAIQNCHLLGSTAEHVVCAGDSAGGNLCLALALKCIAMNLPKPKGLFLAYFPVLVSSAPSPSRILTFMDLMLPYGFLIACLKAYACPAIENAAEKNSVSSKEIVQIGTEPLLIESFTNDLTKGDTNKETNNEYLDDKTKLKDEEYIRETKDKTAINDNELSVEFPKDYELAVPKDPFLSPWLATDDVLKQLPPTTILSLHLDPCLDDCVMFSRRLKRLGNKITFEVLEGLPHGFLYFLKISKEAQAGSDLCLLRIKELSGIDNK